MKKLLSLPPNLVGCFHDVTHSSRDEWFCTNDPIGQKLGSGGGTTWTVQEARRNHFIEPGERCIIVHAGGQSRRLPAYAPSGKILTPIPVFRWMRGQKLSQNLLDLQLPLYEKIMQKAPACLTTMIVSGDVLIRANQPLQAIPDADVVCYGLWVDPSLAKNHGVFVSSRQTPDVLDHMLQKPSVETLVTLLRDYLFLMDIGIWLLSDRALDLLMKRSAPTADSHGYPATYDLYSEFGLTLGAHPVIDDPELNQLKVAILPLPGGEFHHYGTSPEMISSTLAIQNAVIDQREIMHHDTKPHPSIFVQNAEIGIRLTSQNLNVWIENSCIGANWTLSSNNIVTGVPENNWTLCLEKDQCVDVVPMGESEFVARPYGFTEPHTPELLARCGYNDCKNPQTEAKIYPVVSNVNDLGKVLLWMLGGRISNDENSAMAATHYKEGKQIWEKARKLSADEISAYANLRRLTEQRTVFRAKNWPTLAKNHERSVFYQVNLDDAAHEFAKHNLPVPAPLSDTSAALTLISDAMFRARLLALKGEDKEAALCEAKAFATMREGLTSTARQKLLPQLNVYADQIVWSRSPVRIDLAGGWTDTPPYSLMEGGNVVNIAIELNGQPPLQVYIRPSKDYKVTLRSIDLGASEVVSSYQELADVNHVGSPFSIPKAALVLAGFHPDFCSQNYRSLEEQLTDFGSGIEMTMLSAIPAGSGLGTSSILASTVLGAVNEFCGLGWDRYEISNRTLVLEQLLTTGGGWQDQYGGVMQGVKLLQTQPGWHQQPLIRWLPDTLFTAPEYQKLHLLYYTGITRTAKGILAEIVRGMFLNSSSHLALLAEMKQHALDLYDAIQRNDFQQLGALIAKTWQQNQALDSGTNPEGVQAITRQIDDLCLGYKLPGAGGGGYLYMVAKDEDAAARIKKILSANPLNDKARFVDMTLSQKGLEISKS
ncbi:MAG: bifunctional fucokinase/L-fucose-1-P-guanylyltransferase [Bacteroidales bacterium]|nr:bifunctional fucokinase/L-fucose-1-P-guanylyltransferase [Bacteroidales bacterium]